MSFYQHDITLEISDEHTELTYSSVDCIHTNYGIAGNFSSDSYLEVVCLDAWRCIGPLIRHELISKR